MRSWLNGSRSRVTRSPKTACSATGPGCASGLSQSTSPSGTPRLSHAVSGDRDSIIDSMIRLLNGQVFSRLLDAEQIRSDEIYRLSHTICELSKVSIASQRWAQEMNSLLNLIQTSEVPESYAPRPPAPRPSAQCARRCSPWRHSNPAARPRHHLAATCRRRRNRRQETSRKPDRLGLTGWASSECFLSL